MATGKSHDQNFKNLILDYPREALAFLPRPKPLGLTIKSKFCRCDRNS